jgi:hypothetical protein
MRVTDAGWEQAAGVLWEMDRSASEGWERRGPWFSGRVGGERFSASLWPFPPQARP